MKNLIYYIILTALSVNCFSANKTSAKKKRKTYRDQKILICKHNPAYDLKKYKELKVAVLIFKNTSNSSYQNLLDKSISSAYDSLNTDIFSIITYSELVNTASKKKLYKKLLKIQNVYLNTGTILSDELALIGKRIGVNLFIIPEIIELNYDYAKNYYIIDNGKSDGGFHWNELEVYDMMMNGTIQTKLSIFNIRNKSIDDIMKTNSLSSDVHDTISSYNATRRTIENENNRRYKENERRQKKILKQNNTSSILDDPYLKKIEIPEFKKPKFKSRNSYNRELCTNSLTTLLTKLLNKFDGETINGNTLNGKGKFLFKNGNIYNGSWKNGLAHGKGVYTYRSGAIYTGEFLNGLAHGQAEFRDQFGNKYIGSYENGLKNGHGTYTFKSGRKLKCITINGEYVKFMKIDKFSN